MVRYARYQIGGQGQRKKAKEASTWQEMTGTSVQDEGDSDSEQYLAARAYEASQVSKKPKPKLKVSLFCTKGLDECESSGSKLPTATPSGIAADLQKLTRVQTGMEVVDAPKTKVSLKKYKKCKLLKKEKKMKSKVKKAVQEELNKIKAEHKGKISIEEEKQLEEYVKKDQRREERRLKRVEDRQNSKVCYNCRETGHLVGDCPNMTASSKKTGIMDHGSGICFKCGSTEHKVDRCRLKLPPGEYPYAKCFICKETGHLSSQCPDNPRGLYPNGGCCGVCGSVEHYKSNCPEQKKQQGIEEIQLCTMSSVRSADDDNLIVQPKAPPVQRKGPKIVKF